jgi:hypothetical protein
LIIYGRFWVITEADKSRWICVTVCVITLPSLPVAVRLYQFRSVTHKRQRTCVKPA